MIETKTKKDPIVARYEICNYDDQMFTQAMTRLRYAMKQRHVSRVQLQSDAGFSNSTIYGFCPSRPGTRAYSDTSTRNTMRVCMALNVSADWLLFGDGEFRGLSAGEPVLRPEPYDVARDEAVRSTASAGVRPSASTPSRSVTSQGVNIPDRVVTPDAVSNMMAYLRANAGSTAGISPELVAQALQPSAGIQSVPSSPSACAYDDIILKGASNDVLLAIIRQLQSDNAALHAQHARDLALLSEAQTKNHALRSALATLTDSLSVSVPESPSKVGDILSPSPSGASDDTPSSIASDDLQPVTPRHE